MKTEIQEIQRSLAFKAARAKEISQKVQAWQRGDASMPMKEASQQIDILCSYLTEIDYLAGLLQQEQESKGDAIAPVEETPKTETKKISINKLLKDIRLPEYRLTEFKSIIDLMISIGWDIKKGKTVSDVQQWIVTAKDGSKAGLYLGSGFGWALESLRSGEKLTGEFEGVDLADLLDCNGVHVE